MSPGRPFYILHYTYGLDFNETSGEGGGLWDAEGLAHGCSKSLATALLGGESNADKGMRSVGQTVDRDSDRVPRPAQCWTSSCPILP